MSFEPFDLEFLPVVSPEPEYPEYPEGPSQAEKDAQLVGEWLSHKDAERIFAGYSLYPECMFEAKGFAGLYLDAASVGYFSTKQKIRYELAGWPYILK